MILWPGLFFDTFLATSLSAFEVEDIKKHYLKGKNIIFRSLGFVDWFFGGLKQILYLCQNHSKNKPAVKTL